MALDNEDLRTIVEELLDEEPECLSPWEQEFLGDMNTWSGDFTEAQAEKIEAIHDKVERDRR